MKKSYLFLLALPVLSLLLPTLVSADPFGFTHTRLRVFDRTSYALDTTNFDTNGNSLNVPGYQLQEIKTEVGGTYDLTSFLGIHGGLNYKQIQTQSPFYQYNSSGLGEASFGTDLQLLDFGAKLIPDLTITTPIAAQPGSSAAAFITDGATVVQGLAYLSKKFWITEAAFYAGYKWRSQGYSSQIPVGFLTHTDFGRDFFLFLKLYGEISSGNDQFTSTPAYRDNLRNLFNGASQLYGAINPQFFSAEASLGWNISHDFDLALGVNQTILGARVPVETRALLTLGFNHVFEPRRPAIPSPSGESGLPRNAQVKSHSPSRDRPVRNDEPDKFQVDTGTE